MKKLSAILISLILVTVASVSVFAADGINSYEQAVLDELKTSVTMADGEMFIPTEFVNQAENYFNTIEMTEQESKDILKWIKDGKNFLENSGASNFSDLSYEQKTELLNTYGKGITGGLDMTMTYNKSDRKLTICDSEGNVVFSAVPLLSQTGEISDGDIIKTTGADVSFFGFIVAGVALTLVIAGGAFYLIKTKKEA